MLRHYLGFAGRQLARSPLYTAISIGGLGLGLAACILIALFVRHEASYDAWLPGVDRLHRVHLTMTVPGRAPVKSVLSEGPLAAMLAQEVPEVERATRLHLREITVASGGADGGAAAGSARGRVADELAMVDDSFFDLFDLPVATGDRARIFSDPSAVLLTEQDARRYFGAASPVGRTMTICCFADRDLEVHVVGVLRDLPEASHLELGMVAHLGSGRDPGLDRLLGDWLSASVHTYVALRPGATAAAVDARLPALIAKHMPPIDLGDKLLQASDLLSFRLRAVRDLHVAAAGDAGSMKDMKPAGDATTLYTLAVVGALLLLIAVTNFINLATARSARRAREIAVRKVVGATPRDVVVQYLGEAVLVAVAALGGALALVEVALPAFREVTQRPLETPFQPGFLALLAAAAVAIGLLAGIYPAFVLARFQPASVMKSSQSSAAGGSGRLRKVLVFSQFAAAIGLVTCTLVVFRQAEHAASGDLGYDKQDKLVLARIADDRVSAVTEQLVAAVERIPTVTGAALSDQVPTDGDDSNFLVERPDDPAGQVTLLGHASVDYDFFDLYGVRPVAGRGFARDRGGDDFGAAAAGAERSILLNQAAVRRLGFAGPEAATGSLVKLHLGDRATADARIIGVVPDIHYRSARFTVEPTIFTRDASAFGRLTIRFRPGTGAATLDAVRDAWTSLVPDVPFGADYLDALVDAQYRDDRRLGSGLAAAALLALVVAFTGLYGLSSFITESRTREVAIRKVLGAPDTDILRRLLWQMTQPIGLACLLALPLSYYLMSRWLERFTFRIDLGPLPFLATGAGALAVALATVALQALRAARRRPIDSLRRE